MDFKNLIIECLGLQDVTIESSLLSGSERSVKS